MKRTRLQAEEELSSSPANQQTANVMAFDYNAVATPALCNKCYFQDIISKFRSLDATSKYALICHIRGMEHESEIRDVLFGNQVVCECGQYELQYLIDVTKDMNRNQKRVESWVAFHDAHQF